MLKTEEKYFQIFLLCSFSVLVSINSKKNFKATASMPGRSGILSLDDELENFVLENLELSQ